MDLRGNIVRMGSKWNWLNVIPSEEPWF